MRKRIRDVAREAASSGKAAFEAFDLERLCFPKQLHALTSGKRRRALVCGRRAGKTTGVVLAFLAHAVSEAGAGGRQLYVTMTRSNAKDIAWRDLLEYNNRFALGGVPEVSDLTLGFQNGALIQLRGANNDKEIDKIRGKHYDRAVIDEAQSIPDRVLIPLISNVISPALLDRGGEMWLVGTPPPVRSGRFFECYAGKDAHLWDRHKWTVLDNSQLPAVVSGRSIEDVLAEIRDENGWTDTDPTYLREILGQDIEDTESLLFAQGGPQNMPSEQAGAWSYILGVDLGHDDATACAVLGWQAGSRTVTLVHESACTGLDVTGVAEMIAPIVERYNPDACVIDQGGLGKMVAEELRKRHGLPLEPTDKAQKSAHIALLNTAIRRGDIKYDLNGMFAEDTKRVQRDPVKARIGLLAEKPGGYHSDITDAVLYAYRKCSAWAESVDEPMTEDDRQDEIQREEAERMAQALEDDYGGWVF